MDTPTPADLRAASDLLTAKLPDDNGGPNDLKLANRADAAAAIVAELTFRLIGPVTASTVTGYTFEEVPPQLVQVAIRAVALMVERLIVTGEPKFAEQVATGRRLRGFSAGPYSETYFAPGEFARRGAQQGRPPMDPDEQLDAALWALATEDARESFVAWATGVQPPAGAISAFNTNRRGNSGMRRLYGPDGY